METRIASYGALKNENKQLNTLVKDLESNILYLEKEIGRFKSKSFYLEKEAVIQNKVISQLKKLLPSYFNVNYSQTPTPYQPSWKHLKTTPCSLPCRSFCMIDHRRFNFSSSNSLCSSEGSPSRNSHFGFQSSTETPQEPIPVNSSIKKGTENQETNCQGSGWSPLATAGLGWLL